MTSYNDIESKKEEFRKYLETGGVIDALTKALVGLYEESEKPHNALSFIQQFMSGEAPGSADVETLKAEIEDLKSKNEELAAENAALKASQEAAATGDDQAAG